MEPSAVRPESYVESKGDVPVMKLRHSEAVYRNTRTIGTAPGGLSPNVQCKKVSIAKHQCIQRHPVAALPALHLSTHDTVCIQGHAVAALPVLHLSTHT